MSEALYLHDPDESGGGVELYWHRPEETWPRTLEGGLAMFTRRLDLEGLLGEGGDEPQSAAPLFGDAHDS